MDITVFIPTCDKDRYKLPYCTKLARMNIVDKIRNIVVVDEQNQYEYARPLNLDYRPTWIYQQYLKFAFIAKCPTKYCLILDSDVLINTKLSFFSGNIPIFYHGNKQNHKPYFHWMEQHFGFGRLVNHTFVNDFMIIDKDIVNEIIDNDIESFGKLIERTCNSNSHISEFELYGNYCHKYNHKYVMRSINNKDLARMVYEPRWTDDEIVQIIKTHPNKVVKIHTWNG